MGLRLLGIGAFGRMLSPSARHLRGMDEARFVRILDTDKEDDFHDKCREAWLSHGAQLVFDYESLIANGDDFDGMVVCVGKNGDDHAIIKKLILALEGKLYSNKPFILHLSTVSASFVAITGDFCDKNNISYVNYPLTGGVSGAESAKMLILASGDEGLFNTLYPMLIKMGVPKYFGSQLDLAAKVKLISHVMVFNSLHGISCAVGLHANVVGMTAPNNKQVEFFDFLNQGAGGSKQWEVTVKPSLTGNEWNKGFLLKHAVVDALYTAELMLSEGVPHFLILPIIQEALVFSFILSREGANVATQSVIRYNHNSEDALVLNDFVLRNIASLDINQCISNCVDSLSEEIKRSVMLDVEYSSGYLAKMNFFK